MLARGVIAAEGVTEVATLAATSEALEQFAVKGSYDPLDLTGVTLFDAAGQGEVPKWGPVFASLHKRAFAFHDKPQKGWSSDQAAKLRNFEVNCETPYTGIEALLCTEVPVSVQKAFLAEVAHWPDYPNQRGKISASLSDAEVRTLTMEVLIARKGDTYARTLVEHCDALAALPKTIVDFLLGVHEKMKLPSLEEDAPGEAEKSHGTPQEPGGASKAVSGAA